MIDQSVIAKRLARLAEIESDLADPASASNRKRFRELLREHASLKEFQAAADAYLKLCREIGENRGLIDAEGGDEDLRALAAAELGDLEARRPAAEQAIVLAMAPPDPNDQRGAILEIRAGTGGEEAALFAADLFRMYSKYAEGRGWKVGIIDASASDIGGYKEVIFSVEGSGVYGYLKFESGGHRVQRIPVTESSGRIHTSAATVAVFPQVEPEDDIEIAPEDLRIDLFCSSGPGGQSVNTTYSAVRITHLPTNLVVQSQDERSQHRNREKAMAVLKARLLDARRRAEEEKLGHSRRSQIGSGDRSERIRTYNFPQNRLTDHRVNVSLYSLDRVMEGEVGGLIDTLRKADLEARVKGIGDP